MGKISELDMAIRDLRSAAATINNVADTLAEVFSGTPHTGVPKKRSLLLNPH